MDTGSDLLGCMRCLAPQGQPSVLEIEHIFESFMILPSWTSRALSSKVTEDLLAAGLHGQHSGLLGCVGYLAPQGQPLLLNTFLKMS